MNRRKVIGLGMMVCSKAFLVVSTGANSTTTTDRSASIDVADDSNAYLELEMEETAEATEDEPATVGEVTNRFADDILTIDVRKANPLAEGEAVEEVYPKDRWLGAGESTEILAEVDCDDGGVETVELEIEATGGGTDVETTRTVEITCDGSESDDSSIISTPLPYR